MSKTQKPGEKSDKIDNIVGMLMEYERMTIDLMKKATDTPILDQYDLNAPYAKARIVKEEGQIKYQIAEVQLSEDERKKLKEIGELLIEELDVDIKKLGTNENAAAYIRKLVEKIIKNYKIKVTPDALDRLMYYIVRDFVHFDKIDPMMRDPWIEDISCNGFGIPIYIWHRKYESIPTNVIFQTSEELDKFILKLSYMSGRAISIAQPVLDATLPDGSRVQMTYEKEVTRRGSTFTIRKFRERPLTVSDLVIYNTLGAEIAAWFWYIIEKQASVILVGGTASGKTTTINTLAMFIKPNAKIVSIEDTSEIQLPHENWLSSVVRAGFGVTGEVSEITLFDLLKNAMRQRPEYIIVGEVRGSEAYTLMQAIATGHGGLATLHADSAEAAIHRLESEPMNIPRPLIPTIDVIAVQTRVQVGEKSVRRMVDVAEVVGLDPTTKDVLTNDVFKWNPKSDTYVFYGRSYVLENIMKRHGYKHEEVMEELNNRRMVIEWMVRNNVRDFKDVVEVIRAYYLNPQQLLDRVKREKMVEPTSQGAPPKQ
jgi:archaeal flagellar protein FlaI